MGSAGINGGCCGQAGDAAVKEGCCDWKALCSRVEGGGGGAADWSNGVEVSSNIT